MVRSSLIAVALAVESAAAFAPAVAPNDHLTALNLVPEQGRQLVAFSQDYLAKKARESASKASNLTSPRRRYKNPERGMAAAARSLVTRLLGDEDRTLRINDEMHPPNHYADDEVLYPIVGFTLVDGRAMPTPGQKAACDLYLQKEEEAFGYWSSAQGADSLWM
ncbi:hypothetical protein ACHAWF_008487 [Thalassiosira exigua]